MCLICIFIVYTNNMKKQEKIVILRISEELKAKFNVRAESQAMTLSARIKYLMTLDINNKLKISDDGDGN